MTSNHTILNNYSIIAIQTVVSEKKTSRKETKKNIFEFQTTGQDTSREQSELGQTEDFADSPFYRLLQ